VSKDNANSNQKTIPASPDPFKGLPSICIGVAGLAVVFILAPYIEIFNGDYSKNSDDWGNFGSYIGGTLTPIISFLTLLAILVTIWFQRKLIQLQMDMIHQQDNQIRQLEASVNFERVNAHKQSILNWAFQTIDQETRTLDSLKADLKDIINTDTGIISIRVTERNEKEDEISKYERSTNLMKNLSFDLATSQYSNIEEIDDAVAKSVK